MWYQIAFKLSLYIHYILHVFQIISEMSSGNFLAKHFIFLFNHKSEEKHFFFSKHPCITVWNASPHFKAKNISFFGTFFAFWLRINIQLLKPFYFHKACTLLSITQHIYTIIVLSFYWNTYHWLITLELICKYYHIYNFLQNLSTNESDFNICTQINSWV